MGRGNPTQPLCVDIRNHPNRSMRKDRVNQHFLPSDQRHYQAKYQDVAGVGDLAFPPVLPAGGGTPMAASLKSHPRKKRAISREQIFSFIPINTIMDKNIKRLPPSPSLSLPARGARGSRGYGAVAEILRQASSYVVSCVTERNLSISRSLLGGPISRSLFLVPTLHCIRQPQSSVARALLGHIMPWCQMPVVVYTLTLISSLCLRSALAHAPALLPHPPPYSIGLRTIARLNNMASPNQSTAIITWSLSCYFVVEIKDGVAHKKQPERSAVSVTPSTSTWDLSPNVGIRMIDLYRSNGATALCGAGAHILLLLEQGAVRRDRSIPLSTRSTMDTILCYIV